MAKAKTAAKTVRRFAAKKRPTPKRSTPAPKRKPARFIARKSAIHGRGVFARVDIPKGERIIEYVGRKITWAQADRWYADDDDKPSHTFLFTLDENYVIDGNKDSNSARWINHSCNPNCESEIIDGQVWIQSVRNIKAGDELFYDYNITLEEPHTPAEKRRWPCWCGAKSCRGTLLGKKR